MSRTYPRGDSSEYMVAEALRLLAEDEKTLQKSGIGRILQIKHAKPNSDLDQKHADFLVLIETSDNKRVPIPINVKSSERKRRDFEVTMMRQGLPHIRSVAVKMGEEVEIIKERVILCLRTAVLMFGRGFARMFKSFSPYLDGPDGRPYTKDHLKKPSSKVMRERERSARKQGYFYVHQARMCH